MIFGSFNGHFALFIDALISLEEISLVRMKQEQKSRERLRNRFKVSGYVICILWRMVATFIVVTVVRAISSFMEIINIVYQFFIDNNSTSSLPFFGF